MITFFVNENVISSISITKTHHKVALTKRNQCFGGFYQRMGEKND